MDSSRVPERLLGRMRTYTGGNGVAITIIIVQITLGTLAEIWSIYEYLGRPKLSLKSSTGI